MHLQHDWLRGSAREATARRHGVGAAATAQIHRPREGRPETVPTNQVRATHNTKVVVPGLKK